MKYLIILIFLLGSSCQKEVIYPIVTSEQKSPIIWETFLYNDSSMAVGSIPIMFNEAIIIPMDHSLNEYDLLSFNLQGGTFIGKTTFNQGFTNTNYAATSNGSLIIKNGLKAIEYDPLNTTILNEKIYPNSQPHIVSWDDKVYFSVGDKNQNQTLSDLVSIDNRLDLQQEVFRAVARDEYSPEFANPAHTIYKGEELLLFESVTTKWSIPSFKTDFYCYSLSGDSLKWSIIDYDKDGSGIDISPIIIDGKVIFQGRHSIYCHNLSDGSQNWVFSGSTDWFNWCNLIVEQGFVIINGSERNLYGIDLITGKQVWKHQDTGSTVVNMHYHNGKIIFSSIGRGKIFVHDITSGEKISEYQSPYKNGDFASGTLFDPVTERLYAEDGYKLYCLDVNKL